MQWKNICVLGGSGFVGNHIISRLVKKGYQVRVLTRRREAHRDLLVLPTLELIEADIHNLNVLRKYFANQDAVVNLVGILNEKGDSGKGFRHAHPDLAQKIAHACHDAQVQRILHMSALNADTNNGVSHYLVSKGEAEDLLHAVKDIHVTSFRPSVIFGPGDSFLNRFAGLLALTPILPLACSWARFAPIYVEDVAEVFVQSLNMPATYGKRYDLCGPRVYTLKQLVNYVARVVGYRRIIYSLGRFPSWLQANILEYFPGKPLSRDNYRSLQQDSVCTAPFPKEFHITPTTLESVAPYYLRKQNIRTSLYSYRSSARKDD